MKYSFLCLMAILPCLFGSVIPGVSVDDRKEGRVHVVKRETKPVKNGLTESERKEFLRVHNEYRGIVTPTASNMQKMYYSSDLEQSAQLWANGCKFAHGRPDLSKNKFKDFGQNIFLGGNNATVVVDVFFTERSRYIYDNQTCVKSPCGHYTQVAWAKSYILGCGMAYCPNLDAYYSVCNYSPSGNWVGERPYKNGTSCSNCPSMAPTCKDKLCGGVSCKEIETNCKVVDDENCFCDNSDYKKILKSSSSSNLSSIFLLAMAIFITSIKMNP